MYGTGFVDYLSTSRKLSLCNFMTVGLAVQLPNSLEASSFVSSLICASLNLSLMNAAHWLIDPQECQETMFDPPLDRAKQEAIERLGMGVVDKFFLTFEGMEEFAPEQTQYQLLWNQDAASLMPGSLCMLYIWQVPPDRRY